ncbi:hypothetical protein [Caulobacter sp. 1776]|uniref:hypothetical protein n=1 Tax=Caulobacter sp. 1776 TaxID=3156420 RepID=UPI00339A3650
MRACAMSNARHAALAKQLVRACDGVDDILKAKACRVSRSQLYEYQDPKAGSFMPADVIADLEEFCGDPIYSRALQENRPAAAEAADLLIETMETTESAVALMAYVREAAADGRISESERQRIEQLLQSVEAQVRETRAANERGRS